MLYGQGIAFQSRYLHMCWMLCTIHMVEDNRRKVLQKYEMSVI